MVRGSINKVSRTGKRVCPRVAPTRRRVQHLPSCRGVRSCCLGLARQAAAYKCPRVGRNRSWSAGQAVPLQREKVGQTSRAALHGPRDCRPNVPSACAPQPPGWLDGGTDGPACLGMMHCGGAVLGSRFQEHEPAGARRLPWLAPPHDWRGSSGGGQADADSGVRQPLVPPLGMGLAGTRSCPVRLCSDIAFDRSPDWMQG